MKDYISLSTTAAMEECAPLGYDGYLKDARFEAHAYQRQLQRIYGMNPVGTEFRPVTATSVIVVLIPVCNKKGL